MLCYGQQALEYYTDSDDHLSVIKSDTVEELTTQFLGDLASLGACSDVQEARLE